MAECLIIQFAKAPVPGQVKTRLGPALNPAQCLQLHQALVAHTLNGLQHAQLADVALWGSEDHAWLRELAASHDVPFAVQQGNDLGARMQHALAQGLARYRKVLLVGSDCPQLDREYLASAIAALKDKPVVIGAAHDGGYVLIGTTDAALPVFDDMPWGSDTVLAETGLRLAAKGIAHSVLPARHDIDRPADLPHLPAGLQTILSESAS